MRSKRKGVPTGANVREKMDNPLVFILLISVGVAATFKVGQWIGGKMGWNGFSSFFGGNPR